MMNKGKFIVTNDNTLADKLKKDGYVMVTDHGEKFVFINQGNMQFSAEDRQKMIYTNTLTF